MDCDEVHKILLVLEEKNYQGDCCFCSVRRIKQFNAQMDILEASILYVYDDNIYDQKIHSLYLYSYFVEDVRIYFNFITYKIRECNINLAV